MTTGFISSYKGNYWPLPPLVGEINATVTPAISLGGEHTAVGEFNTAVTPTFSLAGEHTAVGEFNTVVTPTFSLVGEHTAVGEFNTVVTPTFSLVGEHTAIGEFNAIVTPTITLAGAVPVKATLTIAASTVSETLTDFPVYVDLSSITSTAWWSTVTATGSDIRVYNASNAALPREVVSINTTSKTGELWLQADSISSTAATVFTITVDGTSTEPAANSTDGSQAVWANYDAVYHCTNGDDSTSNALNISLSAGSSAASMLGSKPAGGAWTLGATEMQSASSIVAASMATFTVSGWINIPSSQSGWIGAFSADGAAVTPWLGMPGGNWYGGWTNYGVAEPVPTSPTVDGTPAFVVLTLTGGNLQTYVNGALQETFTSAGTLSTTIQPAFNANAAVAGMIVDECRISTTVARDSGWIAAEYANQNSPTTFYAIS